MFMGKTVRDQNEACVFFFFSFILTSSSRKSVIAREQIGTDKFHTDCYFFMAGQKKRITQSFTIQTINSRGISADFKTSGLSVCLYRLAHFLAFVPCLEMKPPTTFILKQLSPIYGRMNVIFIRNYKV